MNLVLSWAYDINLGYITILKATEMEGSAREKVWREKRDKDRGLGRPDI